MRAEQPVTYVALLRGVNVGGKNKLPMTELASLFRDAGCADVRTYIQSGNVIFTTAPSVSLGVSAAVAEQIAARFGFHAPIVLRTRDELARTIQKNPFLRLGTLERMLHVYFLSVLPDVRDLSRLDSQRSFPDEFEVCGREIYLKLPNGMARTKLTNAYFDSRLAVTSTARNWNTVLQLYDLMKQ